MSNFLIDSYQFPTALSDEGLKAYWKFDEASGDIINDSESDDSLGSAANLQVTGATYQQGSPPLSNGLSFDGTNDFAVAGTSLSQFNFLHNSATMTWSICWWMKKLAGIDADGILGTCPNPSSGIGLIMRLRTTASIAPKIYNSAAGGVLGLDGTNNFIPDNTNWYFYIATYDQSLASNNFKITRDNGNLYQGSKTGNAPTTSNATDAYTIGAQADESNFFNAIYCEMSVWDRVLTAGEQTQLYNGGSGKAIY